MFKKQIHVLRPFLNKKETAKLTAFFSMLFPLPKEKAQAGKMAFQVTEPNENTVLGALA